MNDLRANIESAVADFLKTGSTANKVYVRIQPDGSVVVSEETSWTCSSDEYNKRVPHELSLEIPKGSRDYSGLTCGEIDDCVDARFEAAVDLVDGWDSDIQRWIAAGNYQEVSA